ncbi:MAG: beta-lactamase family protein [Rubrobacter sp.]|nr:beta-lactamase family protein [Rubrobacter sp.]
MLAKHRKLKFVPGERASYSNLGYLMLGEIIPEAAGIRYEEYVRDDVLVPLGMNHTGFTYPELGRHEAATVYQPLW